MQSYRQNRVLAHLLKYSQEMVITMNAEGRIIQANNYTYQFLGKTPEQLEGDYIVNYFYSSDQVLPEFENVDGYCYTSEDWFCHNSDQQEFKLFWSVTWLEEEQIFLCLAHLIANQWAGESKPLENTDISSTTVSKQTCEQEAKKLNTIFESITDAFFSLDKNWVFTFINSAFDRILLTNRKELLGKSIWEVFPDEVGGYFYQNYFEAVATEKAVYFEAYFEPLKRWLEVKAFPSEEGLSVYFNDISERVQNKNELEKLSLVASKTTNSVIITDAEGFIEWVNESFTTLTGYTLDELKGNKPGKILQGLETDPATIKEVALKLKSQKPFSYEILNYKKNGEKFWFLKEVTPIFQDGKLSKYISIQTDVTEKKRIEKELQKLSLVASKTNNGAMVTDANGLTEWVNDGFIRMTGYTMEEMLGKKPGIILQGPNTDRLEVQRLSQKLKEGVSFNSMLINYRKSGEPFWVSMDISPVFDDSGKISQFIAIQKDISLRREAEAQLMQMSQDLFRHNSDLQQFTYIISHNLRAPVANALGLTKLLINLDKNSLRFDVSLAYLRDSITRLDEVLKDISQVLSIRDKKDVLELEHINLLDVLQQAMEDLLEPLRQCGGYVKAEIEDDFTVQANRAYLYSIFNNLLSNAIKYRSDERTLEIKVEAMYKPAGGVLIRFSDNGSGFDMDKAGNQLFKLYKRFHSNKEGKGIGLFLIKSHVEALGGYVEVFSKVNVGTTFTIHLHKASIPQLATD